MERDAIPLRQVRVRVVRADECCLPVYFDDWSPNYSGSRMARFLALIRYCRKRECLAAVDSVCIQRSYAHLACSFVFTIF